MSNSNVTPTTIIAHAPDIPDSTLKYVVDTAIFIMLVPLPPCLAMAGLLGNFLSYALMSQKKYAKSTTCFYMRCMAGSDSLYIFGRMFLRYLLVVGPALFLDMQVKQSYCLFYFVCLYIGATLSPWILVVMAFDRFVALTWPLKAAVICTMHRAKITALLVLLMSLCYGLVQLLREESPKYQHWYCPYHFEEPFDEMESLIEGIVVAALPIIILLFSNIGVSVVVHRSNRNEALGKTAKSSSTERSITLTTLLVTSTFIAFIVPDQIHSLFWQHWQGTVTQDVFELQRLSINFAITLQTINYCVNSYLYALACKRFRKEMLQIVLSCSLKLK